MLDATEIFLFVRRLDMKRKKVITKKMLGVKTNLSNNHCISAQILRFLTFTLGFNDQVADLKVDGPFHQHNSR